LESIVAQIFGVLVERLHRLHLGGHPQDGQRLVLIRHRELEIARSAMSACENNMMISDEVTSLKNKVTISDEVTTK
jgi:hypothetical protein